MATTKSQHRVYSGFEAPDLVFYAVLLPPPPPISQPCKSQVWFSGIVHYRGKIRLSGEAKSNWIIELTIIGKKSTSGAKPTKRSSRDLPKRSNISRTWPLVSSFARSATVRRETLSSARLRPVTASLACGARARRLRYSLPRMLVNPQRHESSCQGNMRSWS